MLMVAKKEEGEGTEVDRQNTIKKFENLLSILF